MRTAGTIALSVLALAFVCVVAGCAQPEADFRGRMVSEEELPRAVEAAVRQQQESDRLEAERVAREQRKRQAEFELAVSRMDATHALDLAEIRAEYEASAASTAEALAAIARRSESAIQSIRDDAERAAASIRDQIEQRAGVLSIAGKVLPLTPAAPWTELILGGGAVLLGLERVRKGAAAAKEVAKVTAEKTVEKDAAANAAWDEAFQKGYDLAKKEHEAADRAWDEAMLTAAAGRVPAVAVSASRIGPPS